MWNYANGIDNEEVKYEQELPKSIGNSVTVPNDLKTLEDIEKILVALAEQVAFRLRKYNLLAQTVNVQLRTSNFKDTTHQKQLICKTASTKEILKTAKELLYEMYDKNEQIRLVGLRVDNLVDKDSDNQISLFENTKNYKKQEKLDAVIDNLKNQYGFSMITRGGDLDVKKIVEDKHQKYKNKNM